MVVYVLCCKMRFLTKAVHRLGAKKGKWWTGSSKMKGSEAYTWTFGRAVPCLLCFATMRGHVVFGGMFKVCDILVLRDRFYNAPQTLIDSLRHHLTELALNLVHCEPC